VDADVIVAKALDLVLHLQLAAFQFDYLEIVARRMVHGVGEFGFERLVLSFKFYKMSLHGHVESLLNRVPQTPLTRRFCHEVGRKSIADFLRPENPNAGG
jgi:hypothetical protein